MTIIYLHRFAWKVIRPHLRYIVDDGYRPSADRMSHLVEYVVRVALRKRWDLADCRGNAERIRQMMFAEHSELIEMATLSGLAFISEEDGDMEMVLSISDIGYNAQVPGSASPRLAADSALIDTSDFSFAMSASAGTTPVSRNWSAVSRLSVRKSPRDSHLSPQNP